MADRKRASVTIIVLTLVYVVFNIPYCILNILRFLLNIPYCLLNILRFLFIPESLISNTPLFRNFVNLQETSKF